MTSFQVGKHGAAYGRRDPSHARFDIGGANLSCSRLTDGKIGRDRGWEEPSTETDANRLMHH